MSDEEFLSYCDAHAETPRCGFTPCNLARLTALAGFDEASAEWSKRKPSVVNCDEADIKNVVRVARQRLSEAA